MRLNCTYFSFFFFAHAVNREFFSEEKFENFIGKILILFIFLLKTCIVGGEARRI